MTSFSATVNASDLVKPQICTRNAVQCMHCGDVIESRYGYDWQQCMCGSTFVDGGVGPVSCLCMRRGFVAWEYANEIPPYDDLSEYRDDDAPA